MSKAISEKDKIEIENGCGNEEPFALRVIGDEMEPEFPDGCILIIDPAGHCKHGSFVIAQHDNGHIFRQLEIKESLHSLVALKSGVDVIPLESKSSVIGVVIQRAGKRRKDHKHYV
ncbi:MAG: S24 family peptidase [Thiohalomonadales bacterium]